jgi:general secretion pathway protein K
LALVSVLWVLALLSLLAAGFTRTTRTEINLVRNQAENAQAEALADAGVHRAILGLMTQDPEAGWRVDGTVYAWRFGGGEIRAAVRDEGGKIDLNQATDDLLRGLLIAVGVEAEAATALVDAIADFRDPDSLHRLNGAEDADYRQEGLPQDAKDAPFEAVEELRQVLGMTPEIYAAIAPALTVHARRRKPHEPTASELVRAAMTGRTVAEPEEAEEGEEEAEAEQAAAAQQEVDEAAPAAGEAELDEIPRSLGADTLVPRSRARVFTIHAEGRTETGAVFARDAIVQVTGGGRPLQFFGWDRGRRELYPLDAGDEGEEAAAE